MPDDAPSTIGADLVTLATAQQAMLRRFVACVMDPFSLEKLESASQAQRVLVPEVEKCLARLQEELR